MNDNGKQEIASKTPAEMLDAVRCYLPAQSPLQFFVHHNTLHSFEHLTFRDAVEEASNLYRTEPFLKEEHYRKSLESGRITPRDIEATLVQELAEPGHFVHSGKKVSRREYRQWRLLNPFAVPDAASLRWRLHEQVQVDASRLALWQALQPPFVLSADMSEVAQAQAAQNHLVKPVLIRLGGAFLDEGIASTVMPCRAKGFLASVRAYYGTGMAVTEPWLRPAIDEFREQERLGLDAFAVIERLLTRHLGELAGSEATERYMLQRLLMLKGWAGMFNQYQEHPEKLPVHPVPARLEDYLAVQLTLEAGARSYLSTHPELAQMIRDDSAMIPNGIASAEDVLRYEAFMAALGLGLTAADFASSAIVEGWYGEIRAFDAFERRYCYHLAYERHYRQQILDSMLAHQPLRRKAAEANPQEQDISLQVVCCMDEREESFRRHIEEENPDVATYGFAGFFGVAMFYKGLDDVESRALCPVVITPQHLVEEVAVSEREGERYRRARKRRGKMLDHARISKKTLLSGSFWALASVVFKLWPLIGRSLFPRLMHRSLRRTIHLGIRRPVTRLAIERHDDLARKDGLKPGYSIPEMRDIVKNVLGSMGLTDHYAPLVMVIGHGSSSLNNPHQAAYNCGATGGGCGNANARAFAAMANHPGVRAALSEIGIVIPDSTWFIGGYQNTCDNAMEYYDTDLIPETHQAAFDNARACLDASCERDAHERTRRFTHTRHSRHHHVAKRHAEQHAMDWAEPRPEYGHSTNAVCLIGRREKTRNLFLDRRCFLISYDPEKDSDGTIVANILRTAGPVGAGINLEYYFSAVDPLGYGCGTKLPHNITGLIGVMDGAASDLRTGLTLQMVEIHEPMRLLVIVEATPERLMKIAAEYPVVGELVVNEWIQLVSWHPETGEFSRYHRGKFVPHKREHELFPVVTASRHHYAGKHHHLTPVHIHA